MSYSTIKAAHPKVRKAVFCVSNVDSSVDESALAEFLQKEMDITVQNISQTKLYKNQRPDPWRRAFRVTILLADSAKLLDCARLSAGVVVREWVFAERSEGILTTDPHPPRQGNLIRRGITRHASVITLATCRLTNLRTLPKRLIALLG